MNTFPVGWWLHSLLIWAAIQVKISLSKLRANQVILPSELLLPISYCSSTTFPKRNGDGWWEKGLGNATSLKSENLRVFRIWYSFYWCNFSKESPESVTDTRACYKNKKQRHNRVVPEHFLVIRWKLEMPPFFGITVINSQFPKVVLMKERREQNQIKN